MGGLFFGVLVKNSSVYKKYDSVNIHISILQKQYIIRMKLKLG